MLKFAPRGEESPEAVRLLTDMGVPEVVARLMALRGVRTQEAAQDYLAPTLDALIDPFALSGMKAAVERIRLAQARKERVVVYGDYDADGVTATALLLSYLLKLGLPASAYIPDRHEEGYGLNQAAVESLARDNQLLITVDCGVTAIEEIALAKTLGLDVVVTDHHHPLDVLPDAPVVDPRLGGYPFPHLAGVGVAAKLVQALGGREALEEVLDIVAVGTVADIVSLTGENRALVTAGLAQINKKPRPGILALMESAGLRGKELTAQGIGFALGPRINAGGRIGHSSRSVEMLCTKDLALARQIAAELEEQNQLRQAQEAAIMEQAQQIVEREADFIGDRALVVAGEDWNPGVVGIVASRLVERYHRPVFVLSKEKDILVGSGRSIVGVKLFDLLQDMKELFLRYGGHDLAAGVTLRAENLGLFKRGLNDALLKMDDSLWLPTLTYDLCLPLQQIDFKLLEALERMQPMGQGNAAPVFLVEEADVVSCRPMGAAGSHLRLTVRQGQAELEAAAFKQGWRAEQAQGRLDMLVSPEKNEWMGKTSVRLLVKQFVSCKRHYFTQLERLGDDLYRDFLQTVMYNEDKPGFRNYLPIKLEDVARMLALNLSGTLLLLGAYTALPPILAELQRRGVAERLGLGLGPEPEDPCAYNLLTSPVYLSPAQMRRYRNIVLLDGVYSPAQVRRLTAQAPGAVVYALPMPNEAKALLRKSAPGVDTVRALYRVLHGQPKRWEGQASLQALQAALASVCPLGAPSLYIALKELEDMQLLSLGRGKFQLKMQEKVQGKRDFESTGTFRWISRLTQ